MCLACDMEALWFAVMDARANAAAEEGVAQPEEAATLLASAQPGDPPPERGRVGVGVAGGMHETGDSTRLESADPQPNPPPEEGGGGAPSLGGRPNPARERSAPPRRFACEETSAE
jgi:hypothetical protein